MRIRSAPVVAVAALVALAGCKEPADDTPSAREARFLGSHPTCQERPTRPMTRPFQTISVEAGEIVVEPDTVIQPPKAGIFGWKSADYSWRVTYKDARSPAGDTTFTGKPGQLVWTGVREDAACRYYAFEVEVWGGGLGDTLTVDPGGFVEPYSYGG